MPGFVDLGRGINEIVDFLITGRDTTAVDPAEAAKDPNWQKYRNEGYILFRDPDGYPPHHAALGHAERHRSEQGRDPLADSVRRISRSWSPKA